MLTEDERFMEVCLDLARQGQGQVSPNPMVGAVLVRKGRIVARGYHRRFGGPHAEIECLRTYRGAPEDTTLYVNLEPCSHYGKTPPCVDAIIHQKIPRVVVGMEDPNPLVEGRGIRRLRRAGVKAEVGVLQQKSLELNRAYVVGIRSKRPFIHVKIAQTLDGLIARPRRRHEWISGLESRRLVHSWRSQHDAVLVGNGTIVGDNPRLDVRLCPGRDPDVIVLDGRFRIPLDARVFAVQDARRIFICTSAEAIMQEQVKLSRLVRKGAIVLGFAKGKEGRLPLEDVLRKLYALGVGSILVEGGGEVFSQFMFGGPVDQISIFMAPKVFGAGVPALSSLPGMKPKKGIMHPCCVDARKIGEDLLIQAFNS
jgi:diaminohydroxyphosphoribosylaminopyrimidine deaminase / 5-amino-6-(5-phosphoribosylamino)uracil reductase